MIVALYALQALAALAWLVLMARVVAVAARMFQIEEYERLRFLRWGRTGAWMLPQPVLAAAALALVALILSFFTQGNAVRIVAAGWLTASLIEALLWRWAPAKKPLVLTARMRRLLAVTGVLAAVLAVLVAVLLAAGQWFAAGVLVVLPLMVAPSLAQLLLVAADVALIPVERGVRARYLRRAAARLAQMHPEVVAVAGSYGKTSTKHILAALTQPSISVLPTRRSFNTLMGVTRVINEDLAAEHRLFVVEMDAYAPGEIAAMCRLVHPRISVLTSVGPQHLERFGNMERVAAALYEVVAALPPDGVAVMHAGEPPVAALAEQAAREGRRVVRYGLNDETASELDVVVTLQMLDGSGSRFRWHWPQRELQRDVIIPLLGLHQVLNVTAALTVVTLLGLDVDAAVAAAARLEPVEHRLQPLRTGGPVTVIDDSYNANPVGVHNALDVLARMNGGRKILVTPGLVELGAMEDSENRRYGEHAAAVCADVIVMSARTTPALHAGLRAGGLDEAHIHVVRSLQEATSVISQVSRPGDVVLFANDLPDTYLPGN